LGMRGGDFPAVPPSQILNSTKFGKPRAKLD
jgi:hypothetical protein